MTKPEDVSTPLVISDITDPDGFRRAFNKTLVEHFQAMIAAAREEEREACAQIDDNLYNDILDELFTNEDQQDARAFKLTTDGLRSLGDTMRSRKNTP